MFLIAMFCFAFLLMASECRSKELNNEAKTYNEAMEMSQTTGKPIFLYFGAKENRIIRFRNQLKVYCVK